MASPLRSFSLTSTKTAVAVLVPEELRPEIDSLRSIHDKAYGRWQPHINILYPFVEPSSLSSAVSILRETLSSEGPKTVQLDDVGVFKHRKNATIFLQSEPSHEETLCDMRKKLVHALGRSDTDGTYDGQFKPHLTIGQAALNTKAIDNLVEKTKKLAGLQWQLASLAVMERQITGEMKIVDELPFGVESHKDPELGSIGAGWRTCYCFNEGIWRQTLKPSTVAQGTSATSSVRLAVSTYNVMAESFAPSFSSRLPLIIDAVSSAITVPIPTIKVLCFQEITTESLPLLLSNEFIQTTYPYSSHCPTSLLPSHRNLVTLASIPFKSYILQFSERHKSALVVQLDNFNLEIANIHLTSGLTNESVETKRNQMATLTKFLTERHKVGEKDIIVAGDFNLTTSSQTIQTAQSKQLISVETARLVSEVIDTLVWEDAFLACEEQDGSASEDLNAGEEGATFDRMNNPLAAMSMSKIQAIDTRPQRYDRVLFQRGHRVTVERFQRFGLPSPNCVCASDHYGVTTTLRIEPEISGKEQVHTAEQLSPVRFNGIERVEDDTDLLPLIQPYLPNASDHTQRQDVVDLLQHALSASEALSNILLAPLGSYAMGTYFVDSDVDVLAIGAVSQGEFFDIATTHLKTLSSSGSENDGFRAVHLVNSLVPVIEIVVRGIKVDIQYCQAAELLERYHSTDPKPMLRDLVFDQELIGTLSPSSLRPLNTYRDTVHLITTNPNLANFRTAHRFLSLYHKRRGLYSAKYGYLGGIHLSLMLNRVVKLLSTGNAEQQGSAVPDAAEQRQSTSEANITSPSPATIVRTFLEYYSTFNWAEDVASDPSMDTNSAGAMNTLVDQSSNKRRRIRDAVIIPSIFLPTARPNVASSCTRLSANTVTNEFARASERLAHGDWKWCLRSIEDAVSEFLGCFGAYIRIAVEIWDVDQLGWAKVREALGRLESRIPGLMVGLSRLNGVEGRVWPGRFKTGESRTLERTQDEDNGSEQLKGYYLIGVSAKSEDPDPDQKRLLSSKIVQLMRTFERNLRDSQGFESSNMWVDTQLVPKKKICSMALELDEREWGKKSVSANEALGLQKEEDMSRTEAMNDANTTSPRYFTPTTMKNKPKRLRPAQDIISRIHWDSEFSADDFLIGYEDRFAGVKEVPLNHWKTEQTDMEFIPMHRIVWVRGKGGEKVWDRNERLDRIFGSGR